MAEEVVYSTDKHPTEETLSAYWDGELTPIARSQVETHLLRCDRCSRVVRGYRLISRHLKDEQVAVPARLDHELRQRIASRKSGQRFGLLPAIGSLAAAAVILVSAVSVFYQSATHLANPYPVPNATSVALTAAVELAFPAGVDKEAVESAVSIEPEVKVRKEWRGDTLVLRPQEPLAPNTTYSVKAPPLKNSTLIPLPSLPQPAPSVPATPAVVTSFTTGPVTVAALAATPSGSPRPATEIASSSAPATPGASVTAVAKELAGTLAAPLPQGTQLPVAATAGAVRGTPGDSASIASSLGDPTRSLGSPRSEPRAVNLAEQRFQNGLMLWREDERTIYALSDDGGWYAFPDTYVDDSGVMKATATVGAGAMVLPPTATPTALQPSPSVGFDAQADLLRRGFGKVWHEQQSVRQLLGRAVERERGYQGRLQLFELGTLLIDDGGTTYLLFADGRWKKVGRSQPLATPDVTAKTPEQAPSGTVTSPKTATATPTPTALGGPQGEGPVECAVPVVNSFALVYAEGAVKARLGCASGEERSALLAEQTFEGGRMLWHGDSNTILVLADDGSTHAFQDTYEEREVLSQEVPPNGLVAPERGFGKVWRASAEVRRTLGWATSPERGFVGASQAFASGVMFWSDAGEVYVQYSDGRWERYPV